MRLKVALLAAGMLLTGTINTVATKYQDIIVVGYDKDGNPLYFKHPGVQSAFMFLGECLCLLPYFIMRWRRQKAKRLDPAYVPVPRDEKMARRVARITAFAVPALCDAVGTTLMNVGLFFTYASVYQMLRGTLVLFAGMFTVLILRRRLFSHHWLGMVLITAGAALVGASSILYAQDDAAAAAGGGGGAASHLGFRAALAALPALPGHVLTVLTTGARPDYSHLDADAAAAAAAAAPLFGDVLVVCAQAFNALQFILEEKFLVQYKVPALLAVGLEGCWGFALCALALPALALARGGDGLPLDDAPAAAAQVAAHGALAAAVGVSVVSIACFNFFGISVTKSLSGAARATIDACRTLFIWLVCINLGWEQFHALQVVGFVVLICGSALYNEILRSCLPVGSGGGGGEGDRPGDRRGRRRRGRDEEAALPGDEALAAPLLRTGSAPTGAVAGAGAAPTPTVPILGHGGAHGHAHGRAAPGGGGAPGGAGGARRGGPRDASSPGSEEQFMFARSMRLGPGALFPSSMGGGSAAYLGEADEGSPYATSGGGSYYSYGGPSSFGGPGVGSYASGGGLGYETPPAAGGGGLGGDSDSDAPARSGGGGGAPPLPGSLLPPGAAPRGGGSGGGRGGRGGLAAAMRRGGSGGALVAAGAQQQAAQQAEGSSGGGAGRRPASRSGLAPRPPSSAGGGAPPPPAPPRQ
ncbi:MAG: hypothetical protein J3K34DRAFT_527501 [Monoraphidium minutum]|nr:MAG: hypothetical protein J3K34DRAFT_527501 [Monoraphidium minutum]